MIQFILDVIDNESNRQDRQYTALFFRGIYVSLVSLGSGFMFLFFASNARIVLFECFARYSMSIIFFFIYETEYGWISGNKDTPYHEWFGWTLGFPMALIISVLCIITLRQFSKSPLSRKFTYSITNLKTTRNTDEDIASVVVESTSILKKKKKDKDKSGDVKKENHLKIKPLPKTPQFQIVKTTESGTSSAGTSSAKIVTPKNVDL